MSHTPDERLRIALEHASRGWHVFPCHVPQNNGCSCRNPECTNIGKHPLWNEDDLPNGVLDATTNAALIHRWWERWPGANIGIATGAISGFFALDIDPRHGGEDELAKITADRGPLPSTLQSRTGGGGDHYFFLHPGWSVRNRSGQNAIAPGVEVKGDGGYIIGPGSVHASGREYLWEASSDPTQANLANAPLWLLDHVRHQERRSTAAVTVAELIADGARNSTLTSLGGSMRHRGMEPEEIEVALLAVNQRRCVPPLPDDEVRSIARSLGRYRPEQATQWRVGARSGDFTSLEPLYKILTDPPKYIVTVCGRPLKIAHQELCDFEKFKIACITQLDYLPIFPCGQDAAGKQLSIKATWERDFVKPAVENPIRQIEEAPEDASDAGAAWQSVLLFLKAMQKHGDKGAVYHDKLVFLDGAYYFRGRVLRQWLAKNNLDTLKPNELWDVVRSHGGVSKSVRTSEGVIEAWTLPDPNAADKADSGITHNQGQNEAM